MFKFNKSLTILGRTLKISASELSGFGIAMAIVFTAFATWTYLTYVTSLHDYRYYIKNMFFFSMRLGTLFVRCSNNIINNIIIQ